LRRSTIQGDDGVVDEKDRVTGGLGELSTRAATLTASPTTVNSSLLDAGRAGHAHQKSETSPRLEEGVTRLVLYMSMSLDGFIAGPAEALSR
jgi:hypothetical protein